MEPHKIYFNRRKSFLNILTGIAIIIGSFFFVPGIFKFVVFLVGGSFIYFGLKSVSAKPQIIISNDHLFLGFKFNKEISWKNIQKAALRERDVDFRKLKFLELTLTVKSNGPSNKMVREFPVDNLDTAPGEVLDLIQNKTSSEREKILNNHSQIE